MIDEGGQTQIGVYGPGDQQTAPNGTTTPDTYVWSGGFAGSWDVSSNWTDQTLGPSPAAVAPGSNDAVTIDAAAQGIQVISGAGAAASLTVNGSLWLTGTVTTGSLAVNNVGVAMALVPGSRLVDSGGLVLSGKHYGVYGGGVFANGSTPAAAGAVTGGPGYQEQLKASNGGAIQVASVNASSRSARMRHRLSRWSRPTMRWSAN